MGGKFFYLGPVATGEFSGEQFPNAINTPLDQFLQGLNKVKDMP